MSPPLRPVNNQSSGGTQSSVNPAGKKRVVVVVNKYWECDPVIGALLNSKAKPAGLPWPQPPLNFPHERKNPATPQAPGVARPRLVFGLARSDVEIWCVSDLLEHLPDNPKYQSSSEQKMVRLPQVFTQPADFVVAVGTAGYPRAYPLNGCVVVGARVYMHDAKPGGANPDSKWASPTLDTLLPRTVNGGDFGALTRIAESAEPRFVAPPLNPAPRQLLLASYNYTALGSINVTDYDEYVWADRATVTAFEGLGSPAEASSLETTHGLIRVASDPAKFVFLSGITDHVGSFGFDVSPREYAQNMVAAHNAGVALAWMLPLIDARV